MTDRFDVIIVGGGPAGAHSALPLVEAGLQVCMIDGGMVATKSENITFDFEDLRKSHENQSDIFLGTDLNGIVSHKENSHVASMTSGSKKYMGQNTEHLPLDVKGVQVIQTLAKGGLSEAWSCASDVFSDSELTRVGIESNTMKENYSEVIDEIGISGTLEGFTTMPGINLDSNARLLLKKNKPSSLHLRPSVLAVASQNHKGRGPVSYNDLDFFLNKNDALYRARFTIEKLEQFPNFTYKGGFVAQSIEKRGDAHIIKAINVNSDKKEEKATFEAKFIILSAGAVNTTRILMRSFDVYNRKAPFLTKTHFIIPTLNLKRLGKKDDKSKSSLTQLFLVDKRDKNGMTASFSQIISYKSLLLYKLAQYLPIPAPEALGIFAVLAPSLVSIDVKFPSEETDEGFVYLSQNHSIHIQGKEEPKSIYKKQLKEIKRKLLSLGLLPLKIVENPFGSTAHYAGGIPFENANAPLSTKKDGSLAIDDKIYVADSATWRALPAKPPALTIMANARRIGKEVLKRFIS